MPDADAVTPPTGTGARLGADERAELERLRAEVAALRSRPATREPRRGIGWRGPVATVLITVGCLLAPLSVVGVWSANQISDTGRYVANMKPLIHEPAIQNALTDKITSQITSHLNVAGYTRLAATQLDSHGLPRLARLAQTFAGPLAGAVAGFVHGQVHKFVTSPALARTWVRLNTVVHAKMVKVLSGRGVGAVSTSNGKITIDLAPFINAVKQGLITRGFTLAKQIPPLHPTVELFSARALAKAQTAYRLVNDLKIVLPILSLLLIGLGVYLARGHRQALVGAGLGFAGGMLLLAVALAIFRSMYLNTVPGSVLPGDAAAALFDTLVRFIKDALRVLLVVGLVVAVAAFFTGPSVTAVRTRGTFASGLRWIRESGELVGLRTGPVGRWTYTHRTGLRVGSVAVAALIFVFWGRPTVAVVLLITILLLVALGLIGLIGRPAAGPKIAGHGGTG